MRALFAFVSNAWRGVYSFFDNVFTALFEKGVYTLFLGLFCILIYPTVDNNFFAHLIRDIGFALMVSAFIGFAIDRRHLAEIKAGVFNSIFNVKFPPGWFEAFTRFIQADKFIRQSPHITFRLKGLNPKASSQLGSDFVSFKIASRYFVKNCSTSEEKYNYIASIERDMNMPELDDYIRISRIIIGGSTLRQSDLESDDKSKFYKKLSRVVDIAPSTEMKFEVDYEGVKRSRDFIIWSPNISCDRIEYDISDDTDMYEVYAQLYHSSQKVDEVRSLDGNEPIHIEVDEPVLARTAIRIWWRPKTLGATVQTPDRMDGSPAPGPDAVR